MNYVFSNKIAALKPSAIREVLKATSVPGIIPLAAGNPAPEAFPLEEVRVLSEKIFASRAVDALQYGVTEGYSPLIESVSEWIKAEENIGRSFDSLIITSGAQQVMDLATKVLCNEGDTVICEDPSFIGSLNCFRSYNVNLRGIDIEPDGMNISQLETALKEEKNVKFIYTIPNFQNPSGVTMSLEKRKALYALAKKYNVLIIEDNPYGTLRVAGENIPSIKSMDEEGLVIYAGSFSKILAPGIRVGYVSAPAEIIAKMTVGKQACDVHTPMFCQLLVYEWMKNYDLNAHIKKIQAIYSRKLSLMCDILERDFNGFFNFVRPQGGLFVWCVLPQNVNMLEYVKKSAENKVALVPGTAFLTDQTKSTQAVRLNFSTPPDDKIVEGLAILKNVAASFIR